MAAAANTRECLKATRATLVESSSTCAMKADPSVKIFFLLETLSDHCGSFGIEKLILEVRFDLKALNMVHGRRGLWWRQRDRVLAYGD